VITLRMMGKHINQKTTLAMMIGACAVTLVWNFTGLGLKVVYEMMPGIMTGFGVYLGMTSIGLNREK
jgi:hypothetical protein